MNVITVRRTVFHGLPGEVTVKKVVINGRSKRTPPICPSFRDLARVYFAREQSLEFTIEALFFVVIVAISVWPIVGAASALHELLHRGLS
jgi:hypothetical protein